MPPHKIDSYAGVLSRKKEMIIISTVTWALHRCLFTQAITVGSERPVNSDRFEIFSAIATSGAMASGGGWSSLQRKPR